MKDNTVDGYFHFFFDQTEKGSSVRDAMLTVCGELFVEYMNWKLKNGSKQDEKMVAIIDELSSKWKSIVEEVGVLPDGSRLDPNLFCQMLKELAPSEHYYYFFLQFCRKRKIHPGRYAHRLFVNQPRALAYAS